jgi:hypothetical protein
LLRTPVLYDMTEITFGTDIKDYLLADVVTVILSYYYTGGHTDINLTPIFSQFAYDPNVVFDFIQISIYLVDGGEYTSGYRNQSYG